MVLGQKLVAERTKAPRDTRISVELKGLRDPWFAWCKAAGLTPSEAIRQLVMQAIGAGTEPVDRGNAADGPIDELRRHELRMTAAEADALATIAQKAGMSSSRYLVSLLRAQLMSQPHFGTEETGALSQSNRLLLGLVTAMGKAARDPSVPVEQRRINLAQIRFIKDLVEKHVRLVSALLTANSRRWRR